jgi:hypothetical protein
MTITPCQKAPLHKDTRTPVLALVSCTGKVVWCIPAGAICIVSIAGFNGLYPGQVTHRLTKTEHLAPRGNDPKDCWQAWFADFDSDSDLDIEILLECPSLK